MFTLEFSTDNAAFEDHEGGLIPNTQWILSRVIEYLEQEKLKGTLYDINGNTIGKWRLTDE